MNSFQQYHNVSVRLDESDYKKLLFLHDKFNRTSYGKVSLADVLREAVSQLHLKESVNPTQPVTEVKEQEVKEEVQEEVQVTQPKPKEKPAKK
jgi:hypothetical protein